MSQAPEERPDGTSPDEPRVVIRDKRRLDPQSGTLRPPSTAPAGEAAPERGATVPDPGAAAGAAQADVEALRRQVDERTADLQRVTAEFANYRRRVERDRVAVGEQAVGSVVAALLPVLDDVDRAREHGDLTGAFKAVADSLETTLTKLGLTGFGEEGDPFDPTRHEAVMHTTSASVSEPTCVGVMRRGYLLGERLLRPAMVAVADPDPETAGAEPADDSTVDTAPNSTDADES